MPRSAASRRMDTPVAYHPDLEDAILPGSADVLEAIVDTAKY